MCGGSKALIAIARLALPGRSPLRELLDKGRKTPESSCVRHGVAAVGPRVAQVASDPMLGLPDLGGEPAERALSHRGGQSAAIFTSPGRM